jgi:hypothetical protein
LEPKVAPRLDLEKIQKVTGDEEEKGMEVQVMDVIIIIDFTWASSWD